MAYNNVNIEFVRLGWSMTPNNWQRKKENGPNSKDSWIIIAIK